MGASKIEKKNYLSAQLQSTEMQSGDYRGSDGAFTITTTQQLGEFKCKALGKTQDCEDTVFACLTVSVGTNLGGEISLLQLVIKSFGGFLYVTALIISFNMIVPFFFKIFVSRTERDNIPKFHEKIKTSIFTSIF